MPGAAVRPAPAPWLPSTLRLLSRVSLILSSWPLHHPDTSSELCQHESTLYMYDVVIWRHGLPSEFALILSSWPLHEL